MEVRAADALADNVPFRTARNQGHLLLIHEVFQLLSHLSDLVKRREIIAPLILNIK